MEATKNFKKAIGLSKKDMHLSEKKSHPLVLICRCAFSFEAYLTNKNFIRDYIKFMLNSLTSTTVSKNYAIRVNSFLTIEVPLNMVVYYNQEMYSEKNKNSIFINKTIKKKYLLMPTKEIQ